jgi:hypothetical protein
MSVINGDEFAFRVDFARIEDYSFPGRACGVPNRARRGVNGPSAVYSRLARLAFERGNSSISAFASPTVEQFMMNRTPRPSLRAYHCWILPSKYSLTVSVANYQLRRKDA